MSDYLLVCLRTITEDIQHLKKRAPVATAPADWLLLVPTTRGLERRRRCTKLQIHFLSHLYGFLYKGNQTLLGCYILNNKISPFFSIKHLST